LQHDPSDAYSHIGDAESISGFDYNKNMEHSFYSHQQHMETNFPQTSMYSSFVANPPSTTGGQPMFKATSGSTWSRNEINGDFLSHRFEAMSNTVASGANNVQAHCIDNSQLSRVTSSPFQDF